MKNIYLLLFLVVVLSCSTETEKPRVIEINNNSIEIRNDHLKFQNFSHFYDVVEDYYQHDELYNSYFQRNRPIENSLLAYEDFIILFESKEWKDQKELLDYIENNVSGIKFEDSELQNLFRMDYKNMFCNLNGIIQIEDYIYKFTDEGRYKLAESSYSNLFDIHNAEFEKLNSISTTKVIDVRCDFCGGCSDGFDNKRIKALNELEFNGENTNTCNLPENFNITILADAKNKFQKKTLLLGWVNAKADYLSIDISFDAFDENGNNVIHIDDHRESINAYSTKWGNVTTYCFDCDLNYSFTDYEFDHFGNDDNISYECESNLFLNVNDTNLCEF